MGNSDNSTVRLTFYGAAMTVTGSKFLVQYDDRSILVDCGLFQGKKELRLRNWDKPPFDVNKLSAVILTHAHIDHTGYLPAIVRNGYKGPIYCTAATKELVRYLLLDSAHLQEEEARYANEHGTSRHHPAKPLYSKEDAANTLPLLRTFERSVATKIFEDCSLFSTCAGHILGSVSLSLEIKGRRITFSGDVGRYDTPILPDPQPHDLGELLLCEATYGNRDHGVGNAKDELHRVIHQVLERTGPLIIPAFAVGRTQQLLYYIAELEREGKIPELPVFVDSPMATDVTQIYRSYHHDFDAEARELFQKEKTALLTKRTKFCKTVEESKALNAMNGPRIIIAASGMVNGGRVLHHMLQWLDREETTVLFVGYQGEGTRGQIIQSGAPQVKIFGRFVPIRAHIETISSMSAHGDRRELLRWLRSCKGTPKRMKIIHGEPEASEAFATLVRHELKWTADLARHGETVEL